MDQYVVMFPADDEAAWEAASDAERQRTYDTDLAFVRALEAAGGTVTGGAALGASRDARTLRRGDAGPLVTDGPFAETSEQLSGFYLVTVPDRDALVEAARVLLDAHPVGEVRPVADD